MKLSMLSIEGNNEHEKKNDIMSIRTRTYYITEIFMHFLGKIDLDGNDKLVIQFYERPKSEDKYMCDKFFYVSCYYVDKKYKASVYRSINRYGEMWYVEMENRNDKSIKKYQIMKQYAHIPKTEFFKKSYWENEKFILKDRFGRIVQTIEISKS
ncbi:MAG: hypothetical protein IJA34_14115 [Lachnospiraceae bacterium]|nr:hypothetical protein [Lachnospiraceae bacterium]